MLSAETKASMQRFGQSCYDNGYAEGFAGKPYSGKTFIGYYGWLDGKERRQEIASGSRRGTARNGS